MSRIKKLLLLIFGLILMPFLYIVFILCVGSYNDFEPEKIIELEIEQTNGAQIIDDSIFTILSWNIGYTGLGKEAEFFFDNERLYTSGGIRVRSKKEHVEKNIEGVLEVLSNQQPDFILLQEVDRKSKRSYDNDVQMALENRLPKYSANYGVNFRSDWVPIPFFEPWNIIGHIESGLGSFSKYQPYKAVRYQLPGEYAWPDKIFHLDRCALFQWYRLRDNKSLVIVNIHNSAYDKDGALKSEQLNFINGKLIEEFNKGNYVIAGGDWNQGPRNYESRVDKTAYPNELIVKPISDQFLQDWACVFDPRTPSNRSVASAYVPSRTEVRQLDFYFISPNLSSRFVETIDQEFNYSDHHPIKLEFSLKH